MRVGVCPAKEFSMALTELVQSTLCMRNQTKHLIPQQTHRMLSMSEQCRTNHNDFAEFQVSSLLRVQPLCGPCVELLPPDSRQLRFEGHRSLNETKTAEHEEVSGG